MFCIAVLFMPHIARSELESYLTLQASSLNL
jgi:hypothetical protein